MRIVSGIIVGALLSTSTPSFASNTTNVDKARVAYHNLELSLFATWAAANSAHHGFGLDGSLGSLNFLDMSSHMRALLLAASAYEGDLALPNAVGQTQTPRLDTLLSIDKTHRDDIYGLLRSALLLCSLSGACPNEGILWSALDQYYPALHLIGPFAEHWRFKQNGDRELVLLDRYNLPKVNAKHMGVFDSLVGYVVLPGLAVSQMTTWLSLLYAKTVSALLFHPQAAAAFVVEREDAYRFASKVRGAFLLFYLGALGGEMAVKAFVDYAHYFFSGSALASQTRDEL